MASLEMMSFNLIDDIFFRMFHPLYLIQTVLGSVRFQYKNKFISEKSILQKVYAAFVCFVGTISLCYIVFVVEANFLKDVKMIIFKVLSLLNFSYITLSYITIIININFFNGHSNAELYVILQNIDRNLRIDFHAYEYIYERNKFIVIFVILFYAIWFIWNFVVHINMRIVIPSIIFYTAYSAYDYESISFTNILKLLTSRIQHINKTLLSCNNTKLIRISYLNQDTRINICKDILKAMRDVSIAYQLLQKNYGTYVSEILFACKPKFI